MQTVTKSGFLIRPEIPHCTPAPHCPSKQQAASEKDVAAALLSDLQACEREAGIDEFYLWSEKGWPLP